MNWIIFLHGNHKNKPIWIAGSGPSLDTYPDNFLDDKLSIVLHNAYLKFPNATYRYANESPRVEYFKHHYPEYLQKPCIFAYPFYLRNQPLMEGLIDLDSPNYYFLILRPNKEKYTDIEWVENKVIQARNGTAIDFGGYATCLHACMYVCIMMGCNPINIIGCDHKRVGGVQHFSKAKKLVRGWDYKVLGPLQEKGTAVLLEACKRQGIEVNRYKDYEDSLSGSSSPCVGRDT